MPIIYKFDVLQSLKDHGYNTNRLRKERLLAEGVIQSLREGRAISFANLEKLCEMLNCQPGDIIEYVEKKEG
jgi:putative transcriptional regulator